MLVVVGFDVTQVVVGQLSGHDVSEDSEVVVVSGERGLSVSLVVGDQVGLVVGVLRSVENSQFELVLDVPSVFLVERDSGDDIFEMEIVGEDEQLAWSLLSALSEATDVNVVSGIVVLETSAVEVLENVDVVEETLKEKLSVSINDLDDNLVLVIDEDSNIVADPLTEAELFNSVL